MKADNEDNGKALKSLGLDSVAQKGGLRLRLIRPTLAISCFKPFH
jgi:hypothetical protein